MPLFLFYFLCFFKIAFLSYFYIRFFSLFRILFKYFSPFFPRSIEINTIFLGLCADFSETCIIVWLSTCCSLFEIELSVEDLVSVTNRYKCLLLFFVERTCAVQRIICRLFALNFATKLKLIRFEIRLECVVWLWLWRVYGMATATLPFAKHICKCRESKDT